MKGKLLLGLTIATLISANSFALEIYKGKLIKHKEWTTGGVKSSVINAATNTSHLKLNTALASKSATPYLETFSFGGDISGYVGNLVQVIGNNEVYVHNYSDTSQTYYYTLNVCADAGNKEDKCIFYFDEFSLDPDGYVSTNIQPSLYLVYFTPGTYDYYVESAAVNADRLSFENMSSAKGNITISAVKG